MCITDRGLLRLLVTAYGDFVVASLEWKRDGILAFACRGAVGHVRDGVRDAFSPNAERTLVGDSDGSQVRGMMRQE
jgi:hypothetical protein